MKNERYIGLNHTFTSNFIYYYTWQVISGDPPISIERKDTTDLVWFLNRLPRPIRDYPFITLITPALLKSKTVKRLITIQFTASLQ
jgi:hypothetical protein